MIVRKDWERWGKRGFGYPYKFDCRDIYTGWFLFGFLPLYISRRRCRI